MDTFARIIDDPNLVRNLSTGVVESNDQRGYMSFLAARAQATRSQQLERQVSDLQIKVEQILKLLERSN